MRGYLGAVLSVSVVMAIGAIALVNRVSAQGDSPAANVSSQKPAPLDDLRLTVHTLVREDMFAGFLSDDLVRLSKGEKNVDALLVKRPGERANLLAWKASGLVYRAVRDHEASRTDASERKYKQAIDLFEEAGKLKTGNSGVLAITGGTFVTLGERLPKSKREDAWKRAYDAYQALWKQQSTVAQSLPPHLKGELLAGLALSAERTGHTEELNTTLDRMLVMLKDTPYEGAAKNWKADPAAAGKAKMVCMSCHEPGRLTARIAQVNKPKQ